MSTAPQIHKDDNNHWDLLLENGILGPMCEDGTQAAQHVLQRLLIFKGELSLNNGLTEKTEGGTKWFETIFNTQKSRAEKELEMKSRILGTPGVKKILRFEWTQSGHSASITGAIQTDWGEEDISTDVEWL